MALIKPGMEQPSSNNDQRRQSRNMAGLLEQLEHEDITSRRWAARDLSAHRHSAPYLCERLLHETEQSVREAIFDSLLKIGDEAVVEGLLPLLHSEDAALRNGVIELMQDLPAQISPHIERLLQDPDSDVRIFAIDILKVLAHPKTPIWLQQVLRNEQHINVLATAVDRIAEVGTPEMIPDLLALKQRFSDQAYIGFAVDTAINRIGAD